MNASGKVTASASGSSGSRVWASIGQVTAGQTYYIEVDGADNTVFGTGAYGLTLNFGSGADPTVPTPDTTTPNGTPLSSGGGQAVAVNAETLVNTYTAGPQQTTPDLDAVAMDANGDFVTTWASQNQDGGGWGVYAQRFNADGTRAGGEFRANTTTVGDQTNPAVAMDAAGDFVITWQSNNQDGNGWGVYAQLYNASGQPVGGEFRVNTHTTDNQQNPAVAMDTNGFVIAWQSHNQDGGGWGVYARRYNASGQPVGGEFRVNTYTAGDQARPSVAMNDGGAFAIAWQSNNQDGNGWGIYAQRYNGDGTPAGVEFRVNTTTAGNQQSPSMALDASGDLLVTWASNPSTTWAILGQQFSPSGTPPGGEFTVNTTQGITVTNPSMVMNDQGDVVAAWTGSSGADPGQVYMQQFTISFSQESSDGSYAQGDPNDPDQAGSSRPAPPSPPIRPVLPPSRPVGSRPLADPRGLGLPMVAIDRAIGELGGSVRPMAVGSETVGGGPMGALVPDGPADPAGGPAHRKGPRWSGLG